MKPTKEIAELRETMKGMSDDDLKTFASERGVDLSQTKTREDAEAAIELDAEAKAKPPEPQRQRRKRGETPKAGPELNPDQVRSVRQAWLTFAASIPQPVLSSGISTVDEGERETAKDWGVPDGVYRVSGADWILRFEDGRMIEATRAAPTVDPASYRIVPADEGKA